MLTVIIIHCKRIFYYFCGLHKPRKYFYNKISRSTVHAVMREEESNSEKLAVAGGTGGGGV